MNQVHDKIAGEMPFDAVSNQINETITRYLDGKDTSLVGGQVSNNKDNNIIDRFYDRLRNDIVTVGDDRIKEKVIGTEIGGFIVNKDNDLIPKAMESASPIKDISGIEKFKEAVGTNRMAVENLNHELYDTYAVKIKKEIEAKIVVLKNLMEKFLSKIAITSNYKIEPPKGNRSDYVVVRLKDSNKKIFIPTAYSSLRDYIKEGITAFTLSDDDFYNRYANRISFICKCFRDNNARFRESIRVCIDTNTYQQLMETVKDNNTKLYQSFRSIINDSSVCSSGDIFGIYVKAYAIEVIENTIKPMESFGSPSDIDIKSLKFYMSRLNNVLGKSACLLDLGTVCSIGEIRSKINIHQPKILKDTSESGWDIKSLKSILDDMTVGEFYDMSARLIDVGYNTKNRAEKTMRDCIKSIHIACEGIGNLTSETLTDLNYYKSKYSSDIPDRLLNMLHYIRSTVLLDSVNVLSILYALVAFDIYPRLDLYNAFCQSISSIEKSMKSGE